MQTSDKVEALFAALAEFQGSITAVGKDQTADAGRYKYRYADMASTVSTIREAMHKCGLSFTQEVPYEETIYQGEKPVAALFKVWTRIAHKTGQWQMTETSLWCANPGDPQQVGTIQTYGRRYGLWAALGLVTDDDDAASAQKAQTSSSRRRAAPAQAPPPQESPPDDPIYGEGGSFAPPKTVKEFEDLVEAATSPGLLDQALRLLTQRKGLSDDVRTVLATQIRQKKAMLEAAAQPG